MFFIKTCSQARGQWKSQQKRREDIIMCISCGCGNPADNHGDKRNITLQDIDEAAQAAGTTREKVLQNISDVAQPSAQSPTSHRRQDGYLETQGRGYGNSENHYGEPSGANSAQQGYDPA